MFRLQSSIPSESLEGVSKRSHPDLLECARSLAAQTPTANRHRSAAAHHPISQTSVLLLEQNRRQAKAVLEQESALFATK